MNIKTRSAVGATVQRVTYGGPEGRLKVDLYHRERGTRVTFFGVEV